MTLQSFHNHLTTLERSAVTAKYLLIHGALKCKELSQDAITELDKGINAANQCRDYLKGNTNEF